MLAYPSVLGNPQNSDARLHVCRLSVLSYLSRQTEFHPIPFGRGIADMETDNVCVSLGNGEEWFILLHISRFLHHLRSGNMQNVRFNQIDLRGHDQNNNLTKTSYPTINCPAASNWSTIICTHNAEVAAGRGFWGQGIFQGDFYRTCFFISSTLLVHESCSRCWWALLL